MTAIEAAAWTSVDKSSYRRRFVAFTILYWVSYVSAVFFAVGLGRSFSDDAEIVGGSTFYVVCIATVALLFRAKTLVSFLLIAAVTSPSFRLVGLLPYYAQTSADAIVENLVMHGILALVSAVIAFLAVSFLFRAKVNEGGRNLKDE